MLAGGGGSFASAVLSNRVSTIPTSRMGDSGSRSVPVISSVCMHVLVYWTAVVGA